MAGLWAHEQLAARGRWREVATPAGPIPALLPPGWFDPRRIDDTVAAFGFLPDEDAGSPLAAGADDRVHAAIARRFQSGVWGLAGVAALA